MSDEASNGQPRHAQADELIAAIRKLTIAVTANAAAQGALLLAVNANTKAIEDLLAEDEEVVEHDADCEDERCDGECLEEETAPPARKRKRR